MQIVIPEFPMGFPKFSVLTVERLTLNMGICGNYYVAVLTAQSSCINKSFKPTKNIVLFLHETSLLLSTLDSSESLMRKFSHMLQLKFFLVNFFIIFKKCAACRRSLPIILQKVFSISDYLLYFGDLTCRPTKQKQKRCNSS